MSTHTSGLKSAPELTDRNLDNPNEYLQYDHYYYSVIFRSISRLIIRNTLSNTPSLAYDVYLYI